MLTCARGTKLQLWSTTLLMTPVLLILAVAFLRASGLSHTALWLVRPSDLRREAA